MPCGHSLPKMENNPRVSYDTVEPAESKETTRAEFVTSHKPSAATALGSRSDRVWNIHHSAPGSGSSEPPSRTTLILLPLQRSCLTTPSCPRCPRYAALMVSVILVTKERGVGDCVAPRPCTPMQGSTYGATATSPRHQDALSRTKVTCQPRRRLPPRSDTRILPQIQPRNAGLVTTGH